MIFIYDKSTTDFSSVGLAALDPIEAEVAENANGSFTLEFTHPVDDAGKWLLIQPFNVVKCPAPVRETPLIQILGRESTQTTTTTVTRNCYKVNVSSRLRLRSGPGTGYSCIGKYKNGTRVKELESRSGWKRVVVMSDGASGWMSDSYLLADGTTTDIIDSTTTTTETIDKTVEPTQTRDQLFRIKSVTRDSEKMTVTAECDHIFYDMIGAIVNVGPELSPTNMAASTFYTTLMGSLSQDISKFEFFNELTSGTITGEYTGVSLVNALLDPDQGFITQLGGRIIRDNFTVYILKDTTHNRGVEIRHGKNLIGATLKTDYSSIVTRIKPVGANEEGERIVLGSGNVAFEDSTRINTYPVVYAQEIDYGMKVGDDGIPDVGTLQTKMRQRARQDLDENGVDLPSVELDVDFVALENVPEYEAYKALEMVHLYDTIHVVAADAGIDASLRVNGYTYDPLKKQYTGITLGSVENITQTVYGYQIPEATVSGSKIIPATVGSTELRNASITYAKIGQAAVNQLSADSITALNAKINAITASTITTDSFSAALANIFKLVTDKISAGTITTDTIIAEMAKLVTITAGSATFDAATIKNLVSSVFTVEDATGSDVFISNLRVAYAQMVSAVVGTLVIKASDGKYYQIDVEDDELTKTDVTSELTAAEISAAKTEEGRAIIETDITAEDIAATTFKGVMAVINKVYASLIDVDQLYAREAFIDKLNTTDIRSNTYIQMMVGDATAWRVDITAGTSVLTSEESTTLTAKVYYGGVDKTSALNAALFTWRRKSDNTDSDTTWNADSGHVGVKSVTISAGEAAYNAVYFCDVDTDSATAKLGTGKLGRMLLGLGG